MPIERVKFSNTITLAKEVESINSVTYKKAGSAFGSSVPSYNLNGRTITTTKSYDELIVDYDTSELTEEDLAIRKRLMNSELGQTITRSIEPTLKTAAAKAQSQFASLNTSEIAKSLGSIASGFQTIAEDFREDVGVSSDEPIPAIMTADVPNVALTKTSTLKSQLSILTGKTVGDGFLNATVVSGDAKGIQQAVQHLQDVAAPTIGQLKSIMSEISPVPDLAQEAVDEDPIQAFTQVAEDTKASIDETLKNPVANPGMSFSNLLASVASKIKSGNVIKEIQKAVNVQKLDESGRLINVPVVDDKSNTAISEIVASDNRISRAVKTTVPVYKIATNSRNWKGINTDITTYLFETVDTPEELELEITNARRSITGVMVHWTATYTNQNFTAYDFHRVEVEKQRRLIRSGKIRNIPDRLGIPYHFVILRDGSIQRGRPIDSPFHPGTAWSERGVHVAFVAGYNVPEGTPNAETFLSEQSITSEQWNSFDIMIDAFYKAKPGIQFVSHRDVNPSSTCPGFDVTTYVSGKYNLSTIYDNFTTYLEAFTDEESVNRLSQRIVKESAPLIGALKNLGDELAQKFAVTDPATGEEKKPTSAELLRSASDYDTLKAQAQTLSRELDQTIQSTIETNNFTDQFRDAANAIKGELETNLGGIENRLLKARSNLMNNGFKFTDGSGWGQGS